MKTSFLKLLLTLSVIASLQSDTHGQASESETFHVVPEWRMKMITEDLIKLDQLQETQHESVIQIKNLTQQVNVHLNSIDLLHRSLQGFKERETILQEEKKVLNQKLDIATGDLKKKKRQLRVTRVVASAVVAGLVVLLALD